MDLAWAAGFFDGEGSTGVHPGDARRQPRIAITITQVGTEALERFARAVGEGAVRGPYGPYQPNAQPQYRYGAYGQAAERALARMWPYLCSPKREQAMAAIGAANEARSPWLRQYTLPA